MARWWWLLGSGLVIAGAVWVLIDVARFGQVARDDASTYGAFAVAVVGLAIPPLNALLGKAKTTAGPDLDKLADQLAVVIGDQWERAARDRRLVDPPPLPIRWSRSSASVAGRVADATRPGPSSLDPLPGIDPVNAAQLRHGTHRMLHKIYGGLASGRLILVGGPGTGKSAAAILLLLTALRHRKQCEPSERTRIPVPILFTLQGWNPDTTSLREWVTGKLISEIPLLAQGNNRNHVCELLRPERIALFLDGLDEIPERLRAPALYALSTQANFRIVLLTRTAELIEAAQHHTLIGAIALELQPVSHADAADYLTRRLTEPAPRPWLNLITELTERPDSTLALTLNNPLTVTLLRDIYPSTRLSDSLVGDVDELLDIERFPDPKKITDHLLDHTITVAYTPQPGQPKPRYTPKAAHRTLAFIAEHLRDENTRDLAWWTIPDWIPTLPLVLTSSLLGLIWGAL